MKTGFFTRLAGPKFGALVALAALAGIVAGTGVQAQPAPKLGAVTPEWIQRGTTIELTLNGENLSGVTEILFDGDPGLSASNAAPPAIAAPAGLRVESTGGGIRRVESAAAVQDDKRLVLKVTAAADVSLSPRELRVKSPAGISNPLNLNVGQWREIARRDANVTLADAQPVELPGVISGAVSAAAQTNFFRFTARKGEDYVFEIEAARRGSPLDSSLWILDRDGRELARSEDALGLDSRLFLTVPADGEYVIALRDFRFRGGGDYRYRLTAGPIPYVESIFPFSGTRGRSVEVALTGRNLEGVPRMTLEVATNAPARQEIRVRTSRGQSNLIPFGVADEPAVADSEPNDALAAAQVVAVPVIINGRIGREGDVDRFRFRPDRDQKLVLDVAASRYGSRLDALLVLTDTNGAVIAQNDDAAGADARLELDAKKGTDYIVALRDLTDRGGDDFGYRLSVRTPSSAAGPGFSARYLSDTPRVHRMGSTRIRCEVTRTGGFAGPVRFTCVGLPPGVSAEALAVPNAPNSGLLRITAGAEAPLGSSPIRVEASGVIDGRTVTVPAEPVNGDRGVRQGYLTVLDAVPFSLDATTLGLALEQNQAGSIEVYAERRGGFNAEIRLVTEGFNGGREGLSRSFSGGDGVIKPGESIGRVTLTPKIDSEVGLRTVVVRGVATIEGRSLETCAQAIPVAVTEYPLILSSTLPRLSLAVLPPGSTSAAGEAETKIQVQRRGGFNGDVELSLEGLPPGVRSVVPKISSGVGEVVLKLTATDQAKLGTNYTLVVTGSAVFNDRNYRARTGPIGLTIGLPESTEVATNAVAQRVDSAGVK